MLDIKMKTNNLLKTVLVLFASTLLLPNLASAQTQQSYEYTKHSYITGQHLDVAYEGWRENEDGTISLTFGYFNHNWQEELDITVGADNYFSPGADDRGQPTHFLPRRNRFTFDVVVPGDFGEDGELVWTVTSPNGQIRAAYGTLRADYKINDLTIASETGSLGAGTSSPESRANIAPVNTVIGDTRRTVRVGQPLLVRTQVTDDGIPKPRATSSLARARAAAGEEDSTTTAEERMRARMFRPPSSVTVGKTNGLFLSWNVYRGNGAVEFDPPQSKPWEDTRTGANSPWGAFWAPPEVPEDGMYEVNVTFDEPGEYVLWGRADDGGLYHDQFIEVTVQP